MVVSHRKVVNRMSEETKSTCEICGAEIDLESDGWMESDTGGDICAECVEAAKGHDEE
jgi:hypothetical protein